MKLAITKEFTEKMDLLMERITMDYNAFRGTNARKDSTVFTYDTGKKYARVWQIDSQKRCWGFVVMSTDDVKFQYGDILKSASWKAPARNYARGNIFGDHTIRWTGQMDILDA